MAKQRTAQDYLNAPIEIYKGFLIDSKTVLLNVATYACYELMTAQGFEFGDAVKYFGLTANILNDAENTGHQLFKALPRKTAFVGISKAVWVDYLVNDKTELQKLCLLAHLAIKSIIGNKKSCKLTNQLMLSRMDGSNKTLTKFSPEIEKFKKDDAQKMDRQCKKLRDELKYSWGLVTYNGRGVYCSYTLTLQTLAYRVEKRRKTSVLKQKQYEEKFAKEAAKQIVWQECKSLKSANSIID